MIKITFLKRNGVYYGFRESGHAGYAESGDDIVCSAVSAMTMLIINAVEVAYASDIQYEVDEETTDIRVVAPDALPENGADEKKQFAVAGLFYSYYIQLMDMLEDYYEYIEIDEAEE
ncbi:MAG: ribosomal-processing cysteine protease Prp [Firmicutes bacterium]|nr:ribosomal-processing cysteine protease Prp [Bacillota bacterium]